MIIQCFIPEFKGYVNKCINLNNVLVIRNSSRDCIDFVFVDQTEQWCIPSVLRKKIFNKIVNCKYNYTEKEDGELIHKYYNTYVRVGNILEFIDKDTKYRLIVKSNGLKYDDIGLDFDVSIKPEDSITFAPFSALDAAKYIDKNRIDFCRKERKSRLKEMYSHINYVYNSTTDCMLYTDDVKALLQDLLFKYKIVKL